MDCLSFAYLFLLSLGLRIATVPAIVVTDAMSYTFYYESGVVYIKNIEDNQLCSKVTHELVHHWQWLQAGNARTPWEQSRREYQATAVQLLAQEEWDK